VRFTPVFFLVALSAGFVAAFEPPVARSYTKPTADGKHLLVMLVPADVRVVPADDLRKKYGKSGLYTAGDPTKPRWTADWYVQFDTGVQPSNDGAFAVRVPDRRRNWRQVADPKYRVPPKPAGFADWAAVIVYKDGQPLRTHPLKELFDCSKFTDAECDGGPVCEIEAFADAAGLVAVRTTVGGVTLSRIVNFRTGEVMPAGFVIPTEPGEKPPSDATPPPADELPTASRSWVRVAAIGAGVVGLCATAFVALAVALLRGQRMR
jgi:hypothetical protein